jgi:hypothetical protein
MSMMQAGDVSELTTTDLSLGRLLWHSGLTGRNAVKPHYHSAACSHRGGHISSSAWPTVIAALGGVLITACFSILTAYLSNRWQNERLKNERHAIESKEMRLARREVYARYIVSAQQVYNEAFNLFYRNRKEPIAPREFQIAPPADYAEILIKNESLRTEVSLIAGPAVEQALADYAAWLKVFWPQTASGTQVESDGTINEQYRRLIEIMRKESTELL